MVKITAFKTVLCWGLNDYCGTQHLVGNVVTNSNYYCSDSEGLLKLWTLKTSTCEKTFCAHENKAWALIVHPTEELFFSGGADSTLITWKVSSVMLIIKKK